MPVMKRNTNPGRLFFGHISLHNVLQIIAERNLNYIRFPKFTYGNREPGFQYDQPLS